MSTEDRVPSCTVQFAQGLMSDGFEGRQLVSVDLKAPTSLTLLEHVQTSVKGRLGVDSLGVDIVDAHDVPIKSNIELCQALVNKDRMPLKALPSQATEENLERHAEELYELRAQVLGERLASLEHRMASYESDGPAPLSERLEALAECMSQERSTREDASAAFAEKLEAVAELVERVASDAIAPLAGTRALVDTTALADSGGIDTHEQDVATMFDEPSLRPSTCAAALRAVYSDISAVRETQRQQIVKVAEGTRQLGQELPRRTVVFTRKGSQSKGTARRRCFPSTARSKNLTNSRWTNSVC